MAKAIINKHIDSVEGIVLSEQFTSDAEMQKGELLICNDPNNPTIYIMDKEGSPKKIAGGGGSVETYDDTAIWDAVNKNSAAIGDLEDKGVDSTIPEDIVVAGLPTSGQFGAGNYKNNDVIKAGTDIYTILQNILCKEMYPTNVSPKSATATPTMNDLTLTLDVNIDDKVEVGTLVTLTKANTNGTSCFTKPSSISGMTYGYSFSDNDKQEFSNPSISKACTATPKNKTHTITATIVSGFNNGSQPATFDKISGEGYAELSNIALGNIVEGSGNKITISATGATYAYQADEIGKVYYCSNLGNTDKDKYVNGVAEVNTDTESPKASASASVTGAYYYFMGYSDKTSYDQFDSKAIRNLNIKSNWLVKDDDTVVVPNGTIMTSNGKSIVIACPSKYKLKSINYSNQADMMPKFTSVGSISVQTGDIKTNYNVYVYPITNGAQVEFTNVTIGVA
jgi:hypothetical protein